MAAQLRWTYRPESPSAVVLVLHGGSATSRRPARWHNLAVLRMVPIARAVARAGGGAFAVALLRYGVRGWNGNEASPLADARAALDELADAYPGMPVAVVGHSMGGRVALALADDPRVEVVVGLAPWVVPDDGLRTHAGQKLLLVHGLTDRITSAQASQSIVEALQARGLAASFVGLNAADHAMLRRAGAWDQIVGGYLRDSLESVGDRTTSELEDLGARASQGNIVTVV